MVLDPAKEREAEAIFRKWGLDFAVIGETTDTLRFTVTIGGKSKRICRSRSLATPRHFMIARTSPRPSKRQLIRPALPRQFPLLRRWRV